MNNRNNNWKRLFLHYYSEASITEKDGTYFTYRNSLSFISYWFIYCIHGKEKLEEMSAQNWIERRNKNELS